MEVAAETVLLRFADAPVAVKTTSVSEPGWPPKSGVPPSAVAQLVAPALVAFQAFPPLPVQYKAAIDPEPMVTVTVLALIFSVAGYAMLLTTTIGLLSDNVALVAVT